MTYKRRKVRMVYSHFKGYRMALRAIREGQYLPQCVYALSCNAAILQKKCRYNATMMQK